eukprot:GEMP01062775.1.p1 GENE.GEMP01062775.1~~GEMP01062775.1.p1  ORF type:complete len:202 (+),score=53.50 GEMP01062775.1:97-702(+)
MSTRYRPFNELTMTDSSSYHLTVPLDTPIFPRGPPCYCGISVLRVATRGANAGRTYSVCARPRGHQCGYFEFDIETSDESACDAVSTDSARSDSSGERVGWRGCRAQFLLREYRRDCELSQDEGAGGELRYVVSVMQLPRSLVVTCRDSVRCIIPKKHPNYHACQNLHPGDAVYVVSPPVPNSKIVLPLVVRGRDGTTPKG